MLHIYLISLSPITPQSIAMAKVITQETFDDVVKENIVEFSMSIEEAREETIKQFEAQGIHLGNIIKDLNVNPSTGVPLLNESVDELKRLAETNDSDTEKICQHLAVIVEECKQVMDGLRKKQIQGIISARVTFPSPFTCRAFPIEYSQRNWVLTNTLLND